MVFQSRILPSMYIHVRPNVQKIYKYYVPLEHGLRLSWSSLKWQSATSWKTTTIRVKYQDFSPTTDHHVHLTIVVILTVTWLRAADKMI